MDPSTTSPATGCPFADRTLPEDGRPLSPSPFFAERRADGPAHVLRYADGGPGTLVIDHALARAVLSDRRFSQQPQRLPLGSAESVPMEVEAAHLAALQSADLLTLDGPTHTRLRRAVTGRFSVRAVRAHAAVIEQFVAEELAGLRERRGPVDLTEHFAEPVSARVHAHVLGIPPDRVADYVEVVVRGADAQAKFDFAVEVVQHRRRSPGEDVVSHLLTTELEDQEVLGLLMVLMTSGRDSVAYTIVTTVLALLTHPDQLELTRAEPSRVAGAVEEMMRFGTMFVGLFPRTATEDLELEGVGFTAGQTVTVSPVGVNRDPDRFPEPDRLDVERDALGHLGFGFGLHGCIGQQLARAEVTEAVRALLTGLPTLRLVRAEQLQPMPFAHPVPTYQAGQVVVDW